MPPPPYSGPTTDEENEPTGRVGDDPDGASIAFIAVVVALIVALAWGWSVGAL